MTTMTITNRRRLVGHDRDKSVERAIVTAARQRTLEDRRLRRHYADRLREIRQRERAEARPARDWLKQRHRAETQRLRERQHAEKGDLRRQQKRLMGRFLVAVDVIGRTRSKREADRKALAQRHTRQRQELVGKFRQERMT